MVLTWLQACSLVAGQSVPTPPSVNLNVQRIRGQLNAIPIDGKLTIRKLDGTEYHGRLQTIETQTFSMREVDLKHTVTIPYSDVERVRRNYGGKGIGGRRVDPKRSLIFTAVFLGALFTIVLVALANDK